MRKAYFFKINDEFKSQFKEALTNKNIEAHEFCELAVGQQVRQGFVRHGIDNEFIAQPTKNISILILRKAEKKLSSAAIKNEADKMLNNPNNVLSRNEIVEQIVADQLKTTLPTHSDFVIAIDWELGMVAADVSKGGSGMVRSALFDVTDVSCLGGFQTNEPFEITFTHAVRNKEFLQDLRYDDSAIVETLGDIKTKTAIRNIGDCLLDNEPLQKALQDGFIKEIGLRTKLITFVADKDGNFKGIKPREDYLEYFDEQTEHMDDLEKTKCVSQALFAEQVFAAKAMLNEQLGGVA